MEDKMMATIMGGMAGLIALVAFTSIAQASAPTVYTCPICGATFSSMAELEAHFETEHPTQPIEIIWE